MKRGLKLNLIKKNGGKGVCGGGGDNPTTLTVSSLVMNMTKKLNLIKKIGGGGGTGTETKTVCQTVSNEVNTKMQLYTQCRACGTINISKYVKDLLPCW